MQDKTAIGNNENAKTPSKAFREYIGSLVEEIVLNSAFFNDNKKYLQRYSQEEGLDYAMLEKNLTDFFEVMEEWKQHGLKSSELMAKMLAKECFISESEMEKLFSTPSNTRELNMLDGHEYVDLGLPSGTLWATCNLGANKPEDYGKYYAWGKTTEYVDSHYRISSVKDLVDQAVLNEEPLKKFPNISGTKYDVARALWGSNWQMPTVEQFTELTKNCKFTWTKLNDAPGGLFTSKKTKKAFFCLHQGLLWIITLKTLKLTVII